MNEMNNYMTTFGSNDFGERTVNVLESIVPNPKLLLAQSRARTKTKQGPYQELDILSADRYPGAPMQPAYPLQGTKRRGSLAYYGGIYLQDELDNQHSPPSSLEATETLPMKSRPAKRAKRAPADEEDAAQAKQRGRPRLDTQDETAADRRRTQIRLAQRAYRHRKETTIAGLKAKVVVMETAMQATQRSFLELHDNLIDSGLLTAHAALTEQLRITSEHFAALATATAIDSDLEDAANRADLEDGRKDTMSSERANNSLSPAVDLTPWGYGTVKTTHDAIVEEVSMAQRNVDQIMGDEVSSSTYWASTLPSHQQYQGEMLERELTPAEEVAEKIPRQLQSFGGYTYSFQETTLARRLHRLCLERAFRYLTVPQLDRGFLDRTFRFTFCFTNKKSMVLRFQDLLKRKAGESLENWNAPFFHIGGAGTHFPRRDEHGNPIYPPNFHSPALVLQPRRYTPAETPHEEKLEDLLEPLGFGGEWFDSHDVEEYLKTKGIYLTGQSSFFEVDPAIIALPDLTASSNTPQSGVSPVRTPSPRYSQVELGGEPISDELRGMFAAPGYLTAVEKETDWTGGWQKANTTGLTSLYPHLLNPSPNTVSVDVSKFLERMVDGSACLGRAPGFRRQLVDQALALSVQEAF